MDPVTMALVAAGFSAVGSLFKGVTGYLGGKAQKRQADHAADQANQEAGVRAQVELDDLDRIEGEGAVRAAANGAGLSGSTQDVLADIDQRGMFNARSALWAGMTKAENAMYEGRVAKRQGALQLIGGGMSAGSSLATGLSGGGGGG